jgi:hypothetical protein
MEASGRCHSPAPFTSEHISYGVLWIGYWIDSRAHLYVVPLSELEPRSPNS